jgi:hypothetical protein
MNRSDLRSERGPDDEKAGKYAEFSPANPKDIAWVSSDITKNPEYKSWDDWKDEPVDNLGDIIM